MSFTFTANALPWVLPPDAAEGPTLTHLGHRYGNEKLTVRNLKPGKYELKIDGAQRSASSPTGSSPSAWNSRATTRRRSTSRR